MDKKNIYCILTGLQIPSYFTRIRLSSSGIACKNGYIQIIYVFSIVLLFSSQGALSASNSGNHINRRHSLSDKLHHSPTHLVRNRNSYDRFSYRYHNRHGPSNFQNSHRSESVAAQRKGNSLADQLVRDSTRINGDFENNLGRSSFFNLASRANIIANATCGENQPETYCKLVEHVKSRIPEQIQCGICDKRSSGSDHPASYAIDGSGNWWQSPNIANGKEYNYVTITLDLKQTYQVAYVIVKAANSPRPGNWILERSIDGLNYKPWQYFAITSSDCWNLYGIEASRGIPRITKDDQVICTTRYSKLEPVENGEIHVSLINGRPGSDNSSAVLKDFTTARYVRLRFQRIHTLYADLMTFVYNDPKDLDPSVTNRYFYSIKDISIGGHCMCAGPASQCVIDELTGSNRYWAGAIQYVCGYKTDTENKCTCLGNTCGNNCDRCCPLFNQKPFQPTPSPSEPTVVCEECNCFGHSKSCVYNQTVADRRLSLDIYGQYNGGGVCESCMDNTMGINCEMCQDGHYHPSGIDPRSVDACTPCECNTIGSSGQCVKDDSLVQEGLYAGDCLCKEGYCGTNCDECSPGYTGFPYCVPCPCNPAGSINVDTCIGDCMCKPNVCGEFCDACQPGYFNLRADNPDGCSQCFCFGVSDDCSSSTIGVECLADISDWKVTDYTGSGCILPHQTDQGVLYVRTQEAKNEGLNRALYWQASPAFTGNKLTSYGGVLDFMFSYKINETDQENKDGYLGNYDVILEGNEVKLGHSGIYYKEDSIHHIAMNLTEGGWKHMEGSTRPRETVVSRGEFLTLLAGIERLLIRASYHVNQIESRLHSVSLDVSTKSGSGQPIDSVEMCACPTGYSGTSCETCAPGYRRVGNVLVGGACVPCNCYGHAIECDPHTGDCLECQHNTEGSRCERCLPGFKGDATIGTINSCQSCACPLEAASNNFADDCVITSAGTQCYCRERYEGSRCARCAPGFYGNPLELGDYCKPCNCHGNSNPGHDCNQVSGKCKKCQGHTEGLFCDKCEEGYFGTAMNGDCQSCNCNVYGSVEDRCDRLTGQCMCKQSYRGRDCGQCVDGYGNIAAGCVRCECDRTGSLIQLCDSVTGVCTCKPGVYGDRCDQCMPGYYGFSEHGCKDCNCDRHGSTQVECERTSGQCYCKLGVVGRQCDMCRESYWGLESGKGCESCNCDPIGSTGQSCDVRSGQCQCQPNITGLQCDQCAPGYYGFSATGCKKCPECASPSQVCDPVTGDCKCPPRTTQPLCEACEPSSWGYDPLKGCQGCDCHPRGAIFDAPCNVSSGQCVCNYGYIGMKCDQCMFGSYGMPDCLECDCDTKGTVSSTCNEAGDCQCDALGLCVCKANVVDSQCDRCKDNAFSLQADNPDGCTACFCSSRTEHCRQAPYAWSLVDLPGSTISVLYDDSVRNDQQRYLVVPGSVNTTYIRSSDKRAMYWGLPKQHLGDWTLSYNGLFQYSMLSPDKSDEDNNEVVPDPVIKPHPLVILHGNYIMRLQYMGGVNKVESEGSGGKKLYSVRFREDLWQLESGKPASREQLMVALQNVQAFYVKLQDSANEGTYNLSDVTLERAIPVKNGDLYNAFGIEQCICPPEYTGLSCQDPASGYYRVRPGSDNVTLTNPKPSDLIGYAQACLCNGHSENCDVNTGVCINCADNTVGKHCDFCAPGYYGDARGGTTEDCKPCMCPVLKDGESGKCHSDINSPHGHVCEECPEGLGGDICDQCAVGYYWDLRTSQCYTCNCNPQGAKSQECDVNTGQCDCYDGIQGRTCDQCAARHAVAGGTCVPCDVGCTGILFDEIDYLDSAFHRANISEEALLPWKRVADMNFIVDDMKKLDQIVIKEIPDLEMMKENITALKHLATQVEIKSELIASKGEKTDEDDNRVRDIAEGLLRDLQNELESVKSYITPIVESILGRLESGKFSLDEVISEAEDMLQDIYTHNATMKNIEVDRERRLAENLSEKVSNYQQDHRFDINTTAVAVSDVIGKLKDLYQQTAAVRNDTSKAAVYQKDNDAKFNNVNKLIDMVNNNQSLVLDKHSEGDQLNKEARELLQNATKNYNMIQDTSRGLMFDIPAIDMKVGILEQNVNTLRDTVGKAVNHSRLLDNQFMVEETRVDVVVKILPCKPPTYGKYTTNFPTCRPQELDKMVDHVFIMGTSTNNMASEVSDLFNDTRENAADPLSAALSFDNMAKAITEAEIAVNQAAQIASNASDVVLDGDKGSLSDQAKNSHKESKDIKNTAQQKKTDGARLQKRLDEYDQKLENTKSIHDTTKMKFNKFKNKLNNMTLGSKDALESLQNKTLKTVSDATNTSNRIKDIQEDVDEHMKKKAEAVRQYKLEGISRANASVNAVHSVIKNINDLTVKLQDKAQSMKKLGNDMAYDLAKLREQIKQAREQANSIKVSLYHEDNCYRKYQPNLKSATTNSVKLHFKTNDTSRDMLLFLLNTPGTNEYMAIEMVSQKLRFSWNTGGDSTVIDHTLLITTSEGVNQVDAWFEVYAERVAHLGMLSVRRMTSEFPAEEIRTASTSPAQTTLDVVNTTAVYLGGVPSDYQLPGLVTATPFSGCIGDVYIDNKHIGLYNFRERIGSGCKGCIPVPAATVQENGMYQFDGSGYASVKQVPYNSKYYNLILNFKVIYGNALLFYTHNVGTGDYVALELRQGRVVFTYNIQGISRAQLSTLSKYNTNTWVKVDARVLGLQSVLTVNQESLEGSAPDLGVSKMDLSASVLYFGGVPETVKGYLDMYNITSKSFLGCMRGLQITSKGPFDIVLKDGLYSGMSPGCPSDRLRVVGLDGDGHVELPSQDLPRDGEFTLSFRTQQSEALLLLSLGGQSDKFYSLSLLDGQVEAWFSSGNGIAKIKSDDQYNDGYYHTVTVIKSDRNLELYLDDQLAGTDRMPPGDSHIGSMDGSDGGLYLGGVPSGIDAIGTAASLQPLRGCVSDIIMGQKLLTLDLPFAYNKADIGRCDSDELFNNITGDKSPKPPIPSFTVTVKRPGITTTSAPPKPDPTSCAAEGYYERYDGAVAFGDVKNSHAKVTVKRRSLTKNFNITMDFRTFNKKGLMVYITNAAQTEYVAVEMINGNLLVSYEGKHLGKAVRTAGNLDNGRWHTMRVVKKERSISVQVNFDEPIVDKINRKLDVDAPVYVGGVPQTVKPREGLISESFKGCLRNFVLNGQSVDLARSLEQVKGITKCYKHAEKGAYFDGFGYAIFAEQYKIASEFTVELEFRTTRMNGIILTIAGATGVPALTLELYQGQVIYTAINEGGRFSAKSDQCEFCLCDNNWHHVKAELIKNVVTLEVDNSPTVGISEGYERYLYTDTSLYIGGYPPYADTQTAASTEEFFIGCIRNMEIQGKEINWHSMHNLIDVHVGACPISLL